LAKLYSKKVIFRVVCPADLWGGKLDSTMGSLSLVFLVTRSFTTPIHTTGTIPIAIILAIILMVTDTVALPAAAFVAVADPYNQSV